MNHSENQEWNPTFPFILARGTNEYIFCLWSKCYPGLDWILLYWDMFGLSIERPILDHHAKAHIHEIQWISWNPVDFTMKSGRFHEIHDIQQISWNLVDFTMKSDVFSKNSSDFTRFGVDFMKSTGFHMKSAEFHEICWISWNLPDFIWISGEICWISYGFHEICWISCEIERPLQGIVTLCLDCYGAEQQAQHGMLL